MILNYARELPEGTGHLVASWRVVTQLTKALNSSRQAVLLTTVKVVFLTLGYITKLNPQLKLIVNT